MYRLPNHLRPLLADPFGPIHTGPEALRKCKGRLVIAVGDVVTQTFLDGAELPKLMVIDGVTQQLISAMDTALKSKGSTIIHVTGEEDLAALPAMILAPEGAAVCYGQPNRGVVVVVVTSVVRQRAKDILSQMEVK